MKWITYFCLAVLLTACGAKDDALDKAKQRAAAEEEGNVEIQRRTQSAKANLMESDLRARHSYYQALGGKYEGKLTTVSGIFNIRITMLPSIPPYTGGRERQLSEIENDINNLFFYVQIVQWHPDSTSAAVGCKLSGVKPNLDTGYFVLASSECSNLYQIFLSIPGGENVNLTKNKNTNEIEMTNKDTVVSRSSSVSQAVKKGEITAVERLVGMLQPSTIAEIYSLDVKRVE